MVMLATLAFFIIVPTCWVLLKIAPWSAPLSAAAGFFVFVGATYLGFHRGMAFGGGLFLFSALVFVLGDGLKGR